MICRIEKMAQGGRGLARVDGKVVFVDGALPDELVEVHVVKARKDYAEGRVIKILEPHSKRIKPLCPVYDRCGGCNLQHASIELQRELKRSVVEDLFRRQAKMSLPADWQLLGGDEWGYRGRVRFLQERSGLAFREEGSHSTVAISHCPVLTPSINAFLKKSTKLTQVGAEIQALEAPVGMVQYHEKGSRVNAKIQYAQILGQKISCDAQVFFQANLQMTEQLLQEVLKEVKTCESKKHAVDLFSGVGVFASFLQNDFIKVQAVEWNPGCLEHAKRNLNPTVQFVSGSAEDFLAEQIPQNIDLLIVDPPRAGLSPSVKEALRIAKPKKLLYVSCDPVTLARDVGEFTKGGFVLQKLMGFDFYPQTDHLEMLAVLI